jgi:hypothetical protein
MGVIVPADYIQCSLFFQQENGTKDYVTTIGLGPQVSAPSAAAAEDLYNLFSAGDAICHETEMLDEYSFVGLRISYETGTGPLVFDYFPGTVVTGTRTGSPMPVNVSMLARKTTGQGGRRGRGRSYWPPMFIGEAEVSGNGVIDSDRLATINAALASTLDALGTALFPAVLLHSDGGTPDPITSWSMENVVATQRRRLRR